MDDQNPKTERDESASGYLTIDLGNLRLNYLTLRERAAPARAAAVVKADAYGLGAERVAPILYEAGCRDFFVAHLREALALRPKLSQEARIFVLNGLQPGAEAIAAEAGAVPVLNSLEQVRNWAAHAKAAHLKLPAVLQFDTGMSRLGLSELEITQLLADRSLLRDVEVLFVMSHLASADEPESDQNAAQLDRMMSLSSAFPESRLCFANSGGVFLGSAFHGALVRPGIALYGGAPTCTHPNPMQPVVRLDVAVIQTRVVPAGTRVGYGGSFTASRDMSLATMAAGYADGLPRSLSDRGAAYYAGTRLPIVGRVSMDSATLDVSALPPGSLKLGTLVEIIGPNQSLEMLANDAGTISYEILTRLGRRYLRNYVGTVSHDCDPTRSS
jgi:alanine racemase